MNKKKKRQEIRKKDKQINKKNKRNSNKDQRKEIIAKVKKIFYCY